MKVERIQTYQAHSGSLYALSPGRTPGSFFSGGADKVVAEWNVDKNTPSEFAIRTDHTIYSLLNIDRKLLVIGTIVGGIHVIDLVAKKEIRHLKFHDKGIFHLLHLPSKKRVVACCADGSITIWNADDWSLEQHLKLSHEKIRRVASNQDENVMAVASGDGTIHLVETESWRVFHSIDAHTDGANSVCFTAENDLITGGKDAYLKHWSGKDFNLVEAVPAHNFAIYDVVNVGAKHLYASVSRDKTVKIWDIHDLQSPLRLDRKTHQGHINSVNAALWLGQEQVLLTCGDDRSIIAWKVSA